MLDLALANLLSPLLLCFVLGVAAVLLRSDLRFPEPVFNALSIYLMLAIGLKGGVELSKLSPAQFLLPGLAGLGVGMAIPLWSYALLRRFGGFSVADAAAIAAHYGSVSPVTFVAALAYLDATRTPYEGFAPALLAIMEVPGIIVAFALARRGGSKLTGSILETLRLFRAGVAAEDIATRRQFVSGTIYGHLATAIEAGEAIDLSRCFSEDEQRAIGAAFAKCGFGNLTGVHETLGGAFDIGLLRLFRAAAQRGLIKS